MSTAVALLTLALSLLNQVQGNPNIPPAIQQNAIVVAQEAISAATAALNGNGSPQSTNATSVIPVQTSEPTQPSQITPNQVVSTPLAFTTNLTVTRIDDSDIQFNWQTSVPATVDIYHYSGAGQIWNYQQQQWNGGLLWKEITATSSGPITFNSGPGDDGNYLALIATSPDGQQIVATSTVPR